MKKTFITAILLLTAAALRAQDTTSADRRFSNFLAEKFAVARIFDFTYDTKSSRNFGTRMYGQDLGKREISSNRGFRTNFNIPILKGDQWKLTYSMLYNYQGMKINDFTTNTIKDADLHYISSTATYSYFSTLFGKPVIYNGSFVADGSQKHFERIKLVASGVMVLKKDENTTMTAGLVALYDKAAQVPVIPVFSYSRNFEHNWRLDLVLPQRVLLQTGLLKNGRISIGTELNAVDFYIRSKNLTNSADKFEFRQTELRSGLSYEYLIHKSIVLTAKGGVMNSVMSRLTERGKSFDNDHYLMKYTPGASAYFNLGISFNPF